MEGIDILEMHEMVNLSVTYRANNQLFLQCIMWGSATKL